MLTNLQKYRVLRRVLDEVSRRVSEQVNDPMNNYVGYWPPLDLRGERRRLERVLAQLGLTPKAAEQVFDDMIKLQAEVGDLLLPLPYHVWYVPPAHDEWSLLAQCLEIG